jgi:serine-type D-Ala-D-Ala carboxypeptidase (penicillin-binding protein 5/6)
MKDSQKLQKKKRFFKKAKNKPSLAVQNETAKQQSQIQQKKRLKFPVALPPLKTPNVKEHESTYIFLLVPVVLLVIFGIIYVLNSRSSENIQKARLSTSLGSAIDPYPVVEYPIDPILSAKAAIMIDANTKTIIYSKNYDLRFSMASTAKIMTALVALDYYAPNSVLTIKSSGIEGSVVGLVRGDKYYFDDLLYALLLPSANDAAVAIVDNYPGGKEAFVAKMNQKAKEWHLANTLFSDPTGLDDDGNFTTVVDLARLGALAMRDKTFSRYVGTYQKTITNVSTSRQLVLSNLNKLLGYNGVNGIKTGTTEGAGEVLVTSSALNGRNYIIVVMNSQNRFGDTSILLDYIVSNVRFVDPPFLNQN